MKSQMHKKFFGHFFLRACTYKVILMYMVIIKCLQSNTCLSTNLRLREYPYPIRDRNYMLTFVPCSLGLVESMCFPTMVQFKLFKVYPAPNKYFQPLLKDSGYISLVHVTNIQSVKSYLETIKADLKTHLFRQTH